MAQGSLRGLGFLQLLLPSHSGECSWVLETLSISAPLRENRASPVGFFTHRFSPQSWPHTWLHPCDHPCRKATITPFQHVFILKQSHCIGESWVFGSSFLQQKSLLSDCNPNGHQCSQPVTLSGGSGAPYFITEPLRGR